MFEVVEYVYLSTGRLCCYNVVTLWHVSSSVHFSLMVNLHLYLNPLTLNVAATYTCSVLGVILEIAGIFG